MSVNDDNKKPLILQLAAFYYLQVLTADILY